jgi:hypothetical protein
VREEVQCGVTIHVFAIKCFPANTLNEASDFAFAFANADAAVTKHRITENH